MYWEKISVLNRNIHCEILKFIDTLDKDISTSRIMLTNLLSVIGFTPSHLSLN